jgi:hypothetical protein
MNIDNKAGTATFSYIKTDGTNVGNVVVKRTLNETDPTPTPAPILVPISQFNKTAALNFIKSMYDPSAQLVKECPSTTTCPKKWLWSDQLVAQIALKHIDPAMATSIENKMNSYNITMKNPWATLDPQYRDKFSVGGTTERPVGSSNLWYSDYSGSPLSCANYADIAFLSAIHYFYNGDNATAKACYQEGREMFDGIGMDDAGSITGEYAVYKTALGLLAEKITGFDPIGITINYFDRFQAANGGITTDITGAQPVGSQNVETTFAVLAAMDPSLLKDPIAPTSTPTTTPTPTLTPTPTPGPTPTPEPDTNTIEFHTEILNNTKKIMGLLSNQTQ